MLEAARLGPGWRGEVNFRRSRRWRHVEVKLVLARLHVADECRFGSDSRNLGFFAGGQERKQLQRRGFVLRLGLCRLGRLPGVGWALNGYPSIIIADFSVDCGFYLLTGGKSWI